MKRLTMPQTALAALALLALPGLVGAQTSATSTKAPAHKTTTKAAATPAKLVDINTATMEELAALPGIGDTYAQKIIAGRPYKEKSDLVQRHVIPSSSYSKVKAHIVAHQ